MTIILSKSLTFHKKKNIQKLWSKHQLVNMYYSKKNIMFINFSEKIDNSKFYQTYQFPFFLKKVKNSIVKYDLGINTKGKYYIVDTNFLSKEDIKIFFQNINKYSDSIGLFEYFIEKKEVRSQKYDNRILDKSIIITDNKSKFSKKIKEDIKVKLNEVSKNIDIAIRNNEVNNIEYNMMISLNKIKKLNKNLFKSANIADYNILDDKILIQ